MSYLSPRGETSSTTHRAGADDINYTKEAFLNSWNLTFLAVAAVIISLVALVGEWPLALAAVLLVAIEAAYLGVVPRQERFRRAVRSREAPRQIERQRRDSQKAIYRQLSRRSQRRYVRLRDLEDTIKANYAKLSTASQRLLESHLQKISGLLEAHLNLLHRHEQYLDATDAATESEVRRSIEAVRERMEEAPPRVREVKERRLRILKQRLHRFREGHENRAVIEAQLQTIEDAVRYIHEQSWTLPNPDEITHQLDTLLGEVEETQQSVRAVEDVYTRSPDDLLRELEELDDPHAPQRRDPQSASRSRQRG